MISSWHKHTAEPAEIFGILMSSACHGSRLNSAWDLVWAGREGCPDPQWEQGQILRSGGLGFACALPVLKSCFTLCGRPKTTALPSWRWFFNLLAEKAESCSLDSIWKIKGDFLNVIIQKKLLLQEIWELYFYFLPSPYALIYTAPAKWHILLFMDTVQFLYLHYLQRGCICYSERWIFTQQFPVPASEKCLGIFFSLFFSFFHPFSSYFFFTFFSPLFFSFFSFSFSF